MYFSHNPGAHLLFELRSHQLSVFILQGRAGSGSAGDRRDRRSRAGI